MVDFNGIGGNGRFGGSRFGGGPTSWKPSGGFGGGFGRPANPFARAGGYSTQPAPYGGNGYGVEPGNSPMNGYTGGGQPRLGGPGASFGGNVEPPGSPMNGYSGGGGVRSSGYLGPTSVGFHPPSFNGMPNFSNAQPMPMPNRGGGGGGMRDTGMTQGASPFPGMGNVPFSGNIMGPGGAQNIGNGAPSFSDGQVGGGDPYEGDPNGFGGPPAGYGNAQPMPFPVPGAGGVPRTDQVGGIGQAFDPLFRRRSTGYTFG